MTEIQKERLYRRAYERLDKLFRGGGPDMFGWYDWRTIKLLYPGWAKTLQLILEL